MAGWWRGTHFQVAVRRVGCERLPSRGRAPERVVGDAGRRPAVARLVEAVSAPAAGAERQRERGRRGRPDHERRLAGGAWRTSGLSASAARRGRSSSSATTALTRSRRAWALKRRGVEVRQRAAEERDAVEALDQRGDRARARRRRGRQRGDRRGMREGAVDDRAAGGRGVSAVTWVCGRHHCRAVDERHRRADEQHAARRRGAQRRPQRRQAQPALGGGVGGPHAGRGQSASVS